MSTIDMGSPAINRASQYDTGGGYIIFKDNPANASGTIGVVEIWAAGNLTNVKVATMRNVSGNNFTTISSTTIGSVTGGSKQTFSGLSLTVATGDYLGAVWSGNLEYATTGGSDYWFDSTYSDRSPYSNVSFGSATNTGIFSMYAVDANSTTYTKTLTAGVTCGATLSYGRGYFKTLTAGVKCSVGNPFVNLITNGDFSNGTTGYLANKGNITANNNTLTYEITSTSANLNYIYKNSPALEAGKKYYISFEFTGKYAMGYGLFYAPDGVFRTNTAVANVKTFFSRVFTPINSGIMRLYFDTSSNYAIGNTVTFKNYRCVCISDVFGAGNEPTAAQMDALLPDWFDGTTYIGGMQKSIAKSLTATVLSSVGVVKGIAKSLSAGVKAGANVAKNVGKRLTASVKSSVSIIRNFTWTKSLTAGVKSSVSISKNISKALTAGVKSSAVFTSITHFWSKVKAFFIGMHF